MASRHLPAVVAAVLSGVVVAGVGLAAGSEDTETATGPSSTSTTVERSTTTTDDDGSTTTTVETTTSTAAPETTTTVTSGASTTATTRASSPTTRTPTTTAAPAPTTTAPAPPFFEVVAGPSPAQVPGCGGVSSVTIRNRGGQIGRFSLSPSQPSWVEITAPQLTLAPGGETTVKIAVVDDKNGPDSFSVNVLNATTGQSDGAFAIGVSKVEGLNSTCAPLSAP